MSLATLPFGVNAGRPLPDVPTSYLAWVARHWRLSSGLRSAVAADLERRGEPVPAARPARIPACPKCGPAAKVSYCWGQDRAGRKYIRCECRACRKWLGAAPLVEPFLSLANASASTTPVLDTLIAAEAAGVALVNDGRAVDFAPGDWHKAPPELRASLRACKATLAGMLPRGMTGG